MKCRRLVTVLAVAIVLLTSCGVSLQQDPEPLPSDVVPTSQAAITP